MVTICFFSLSLEKNNDMRKIFTIGLLALSVNAFGQIPTDGLVAHYSFDGNANDLSGNGNHGTVNGATLVADRNGNVGSAYSFDGSTNYIDVAHSGSLTFSSNAISISFWANIASVPTSGNDIMISKQSGSGTTQQGFNLFTNQDQTNGLQIRNGSGGTWGGANILNVSLNEYHHIVYTFDNGIATAYIDGIQTSYLTGQTAVIGSNTMNLLIGKANWSNVNSPNFHGIIDEIQIYNRALTETEVTSMYTVCTNPTATITPQGSTTICFGSSVLLSANSGDGYTYQWLRDGVVISGQTGISYSASQSGSYTVSVIDGDCSALSSPVSVVVNANPDNSVSASGSTTFCAGGSVTLTAVGSGSYLWSNGATTNSITVSQSGSYSVVVTSNGCSSTSTSTSVTVNSNPTVSLSGISSFTEINFTVSLSGTPIGGVFTGSGVSGSTLEPQEAGLGTTSVTYTYTDGNSCSSSSTQSTIIYDTLGTVCTDYETIYTYISVTDTLIIEATLGLPSNETNIIKIYPNPASTHVSINTGDFALMNGYTIKIDNAVGQTVFSTQIEQQEYLINLSTWTGSGTYFVYIIDGQQNIIETKKIIIQ
jgi:hypothetical protein